MKVLIAYYSRTTGTEKVAEVLKREFENRGHLVDVEKVKPIKEHSFLAWFFIRIFKGECPIQPPKIKDVSGYDVICIGSPNWTRLSLPMARYLQKIEGLKYKNIGFFATTAAWPIFEWYVFSAFLLDLTFWKIIEKKRGRVIESILFSSLFKQWSVVSEYGRRSIKNFVEKTETPIYSFKDYFLKQKEIEDTRFLVIIFSALLLISLIFQIISSLVVFPILTWSEFLFLFLVGFLTYLAILTTLVRRTSIFWGKYLSGISLVIGLTLLIFYLTPLLEKMIPLGYALILIFISYFRNVRAVFFTGLVTILSYLFLFFYYPQKEIFSPVLDFFILALTLGVISWITYHLQRYHIATLETQDDIEKARVSLEKKVAARTKELEELTEKREEIIKERTKELQEKIEELEKFHRVIIDREIKMIELKKEIEKLKEELEKSKLN